MPKSDHARALRPEHDVAGPELAVHQPGLVDGGQAGRHSDGQRLQFAAVRGPSAVTVPDSSGPATYSLTR